MNACLDVDLFLEPFTKFDPTLWYLHLQRIVDNLVKFAMTRGSEPDTAQKQMVDKLLKDHQLLVEKLENQQREVERISKDTKILSDTISCTAQSAR